MLGPDFGLMRYLIIAFYILLVVLCIRLASILDYITLTRGTILTLFCTVLATTIHTYFKAHMDGQRSLLHSISAFPRFRRLEWIDEVFDMFKIDPWEFWGVEKAVLRNEKVDFGEEQVLRLKDSRVSTPQSIGGTFWMLVRDREWEEDKEWKRIGEQRVWRRRTLDAWNAIDRAEEWEEEGGLARRCYKVKD